MFLDVKTSKGKTITAYCLKNCGPWFTAPDENDFSQLKKGIKGKKVIMEYTTEINRGRVAGPADDEPVELVKKILFIK